MSRLPVPGGDSGNWGAILNDFLGVEHNTDGTLKAPGSLAAKANDAAVVHITGAETIAGTKTFQAPLVIPTPTNASHAATKAYVDGVPQAVVALPAATGSDDTTAINAILAANAGKRIVGKPGESYKISAPLIIYSGTTLDMTATTITLLAGSNSNMLQNQAVASVRRVLDAVMTASSATLTSASVANSVGASVYAALLP